MVSQRRSMQSQGVPIPDRLPARRPQTIQGKAETTRVERVRSPRPARYTPPPRTRREYIPPESPRQEGSGIGALEAEFLVAIALLVMLMFANNSASFTDKIMSFMKRGTLVCVLFFVLALVASAGPNATKAAKAFGALIIVGIFLTSPVTTVLKDFDNIIKNDWTGTGESAHDSTGSADTGTQTGTTAPSNPAQSFINSLEQQLKLQGQSSSKGPTDLKTNVGNAVANTLNGIIPGSGDIVKKLFGL